jgi:hypothetical protein
MSSRPILSPFPVIINGNMSGNITSAVTVIQNLTMIGYDISWAGIAPVGTMSVQVSNTYSQYSDGTVNNPGNWTTLTLSEVPAVSGSTGNGFIDVDATGAYAMRLVYNFTSGTGLMQATINAKVA